MSMSQSYLSGRVAYTVVDVGLDAGAAVRTDAIIVITLFIKAFSHGKQLTKMIYFLERRIRRNIQIFSA